MSPRMSRIRTVTLLVGLLHVVGCSQATVQRQQEANARAARLGHPEVAYTESLSPGTAFALGFLPFGAAGLYVDNSKLAASGLLWPFSMLWMPKKAHDQAVDANDREFESRLMRSLERDGASRDQRNGGS
jgi:hypothetical protein